MDKFRRSSLIFTHPHRPLGVGKSAMQHSCACGLSPGKLQRICRNPGCFIHQRFLNLFS